MTVFTYKLLKFLSVLCFTFCLNGQLMSQDCPFGIENCKGGCGRWIDEDGDGICDMSVMNSSDTVELTDTTPTIINVQNNPKTQVHNDAKHHDNLLSIITTDETSTDSIQQEIEPEINALSEEQTSTQKRKPRYNLILYSSLTIGAYFLSLVLLKRNIYSKKIHRRIWNILLLVTFLISGLLGLLLVVQINYGILIQHFRQFMQWHVDFGIAMSLISVFHIIWHFSYFKNMFRRSSHKPE
jgi:hypothetical protein